MIRLKKWYNKKETALQKGSDEYHIYLERTKGINISEKRINIFTRKEIIHERNTLYTWKRAKGLNISEKKGLIITREENSIQKKNSEWEDRRRNSSSTFRE